ncbi:hypothetical protein GW17_00028533, partial [Ensete ventricosum]
GSTNSNRSGQEVHAAATAAAAVTVVISRNPDRLTQPRAPIFLPFQREIPFQLLHHLVHPPVEVLCQHRRLHVHPQETAPILQPLYPLPCHHSLRLPGRAKRVVPEGITFQEQRVDKGVGPARQHRNSAASGNVAGGAVRQGAEHLRLELTRLRVELPYQMVRHPAPLHHGYLVGGDVEARWLAAELKVVATTTIATEVTAPNPPSSPVARVFLFAPKSVEPLLISAAGGVGHPVACAPVGPDWRNCAIRLLTSAMRPIRLPEPSSGLMGMPEIFEGGVNVIRRAVVIGNGSAGSENQSLGLVRALGLSDKYSIHVLSIGALHQADSAALRIAATAWHDELAPLPKPLLVVNIGGPTSNTPFICNSELVIEVQIIIPLLVFEVKLGLLDFFHFVGPSLYCTRVGKVQGCFLVVVGCMARSASELCDMTMLEKA